MLFFSNVKRSQKREMQWGIYSGFRLGDFKREREREHFSLKYCAIGPSAVFGIRRKAALRGADYVWTPKIWSFDKLKEVGFSPYLGFIPSLSTLRMFESIEAVRGRLIGPKPWNRINMNF